MTKKKSTPNLAHVVYRTRRLEPMLAWYTEMFHAIPSDGRAVVLEEVGEAFFLKLTP